MLDSTLKAKRVEMPVHALVDPGGVAVFLDRFCPRIGVLQAFAVIDPHFRMQIRVLMRP